MNNYTFSEISVGMKEQFEVTITSDFMDKFYDITKDCNPMHHNDEYASSKGYKGRIAFGMLVSSFLSTLAGVYLPGEHCIIHSVEVKFKNPVYVNDKLTISGTVKSIDERFHTIEVQINITNQNSEKVVRGTMICGVIGEENE